MRRLAPMLCLLLLAVLPWLAAEAECQTIKPPPKSPPGSATPWSAPERFDPDNIPKTDGPEEAERLRSLKCHIREIEELGRLYVEDAIDRSHYWIQLSNKVKIRAADPASFDGRKKLKVEDLAIGQRLVVTVRTKDEEILKVEVRPPAAAKKTLG